MVYVTACSLHIPHKRWAYDDPNQENPEREEDNYRYLEEWSRRFLDCFK
jgi:hypothetical protein